jgi:hypothetical protein
MSSPNQEYGEYTLDNDQPRDSRPDIPPRKRSKVSRACDEVCEVGEYSNHICLLGERCPSGCPSGCPCGCRGGCPSIVLYSILFVTPSCLSFCGLG